MDMDGGVIRMHETGKPSAQTVLKTCPCCGGEARFETYRVEDGYIGHEVGDIICLECGLRTISAPVDGYCGVAWTREDFAARWNRRTEEKIDLPMRKDGYHAKIVILII